jgi:hypothetical protein
MSWEDHESKRSTTEHFDNKMLQLPDLHKVPTDAGVGYQLWKSS